MGNAIRCHFVIEITFNVKYIAIEDLVHKKLIEIFKLYICQ
ncbi:Uncharacterised protein [Serratia fonticola]|nr:hypothetical protein DFO62_104268 [Serratia fonticola]CAI1018201.1 Uncharacterised protein [Serratia fonticola]